jgi:hypothetical protein
MNQMADEPESSGSVQRDDPSSAGGFFNLTATCAIEEHYLCGATLDLRRPISQLDGSPKTIAVKRWNIKSF